MNKQCQPLLPIDSAKSAYVFNTSIENAASFRACLKRLRLFRSHMSHVSQYASSGFTTPDRKWCPFKAVLVGQDNFGCVASIVRSVTPLHSEHLYRVLVFVVVATACRPFLFEHATPECTDSFRTICLRCADFGNRHYDHGD